jgi:hypothetical protein
MPEIDVMHVWRVRNEPPAYEATTPDGSLIHTEDENFSVQDLAEIGAEYGVTRWSERGADDGLDLDEMVVIVGWADAVIGRDDVQRSYHRGENGAPMVNIKVQSFELPEGDAFADLLSEFALDSKLAALKPADLRTLVERYIEKHWEPLFEVACEQGYESAADDAKATFFSAYPVKTHTAGRSGGWLVVEGLPDVDSWEPKLLKAWSEFEAACKAQVEDIPRAMAWSVLANDQDELAGRVVRVELTLTLSDEDLEALGSDPLEWDWRDMLDLGRDSEIDVRPI